MPEVLKNLSLLLSDVPNLVSVAWSDVSACERVELAAEPDWLAHLDGEWEAWRDSSAALAFANGSDFNAIVDISITTTTAS